MGDGVELAVCRAYLAAHSSIFACASNLHASFSANLSRASSDGCAGCAGEDATGSSFCVPEVINLDEDVGTLELLLGFCTPCRPPRLGNLSFGEASRLLDAAYKYEVYAAMPATENACRRFIKSRPVDVFALAHRLDINELADDALLATECVPFLKEPYIYMADLDARGFARLHRFHFKRCSEIQAALRVIERDLVTPHFSLGTPCSSLSDLWRSFADNWYEEPWAVEAAPIARGWAGVVESNPGLRDCCIATGWRIAHVLREKLEGLSPP